MRFLVLLALLVLCSAGLVDEVFTFCCEDTLCSRNFDLSDCHESYARLRFSHMLNQVMQEQSLTESSPIEVVEHAARYYQFCSYNEHLQAGLCVCQHGKRCDLMHSSDFHLSPWIQNIIAIATLLLVVFYSGKLLSELESISNTPHNLEEMLETKYNN